MKINIYHQFNPKASASGGIGKFILNFIKDAPLDWQFSIVCCSSEKAGATDSLNVYGRTVNLIYVMKLQNENNRRIFPITISYVFGLYKHINLIPSANIHFIQRLEYSLFVCKKFKKEKKCILFHNDYENILDKNKSESYWAKLPNIYMRVVGFFVNKLELTLTVNSNTKKLINSYLNKEIVQFIPTWPDRTKFFIQDHLIKAQYKAGIIKKIPVLDGARVLLFVGRLQSQKNPFLALDLIRQSGGNYHLLVAGDGNMKNELISYCHTHKIDKKVTFLGNVEQRELLNLYNFSDLYLSTSHFEGMSVALLEALACGLPVLTTPTGESASIVKFGENGAVTEDFSIVALLKSLKSIENIKFNKDNVSLTIQDYDSSPLVQKFLELA